MEFKFFMDGNAENVWEEHTISIMWSVTLSFNEISFQKKKIASSNGCFLQPDEEEVGVEHGIALNDSCVICSWAQ